MIIKLQVQSEHNWDQVIRMAISVSVPPIFMYVYEIRQIVMQLH